MAESITTLVDDIYDDIYQQHDTDDAYSELARRLKDGVERIEAAVKEAKRRERAWRDLDPSITAREMFRQAVLREALSIIRSSLKGDGHG